MRRYLGLELEVKCSIQLELLPRMARQPLLKHLNERIVCCALGTLEKVVAALYEQTMHPPEKIHAPWVAHNEAQAHCGLRWLEALPGQRWLALDRLTQADITTVAMFDFARIVNPALVISELYPRLDALSAHCNTLSAFAATRPVGDVDRANPTLPT